MPEWPLPGGGVADFRVDQAAGLRRLFGASQLQVVAFAAGSEGVGRSVAVANTAAALARLGKEVLVLDENPAGGDVAACFGLTGRFDLLHLLNGERKPEEVLIAAMPGVSILPAAQAVNKLGRLNTRQQQSFIAAMQRLAGPLDVVLVDAGTHHPAGFSPLGLAAHETVMALSASGSSITEAYALIKKVSQSFARRHFRILVSKVRCASDARAIFENIAEVTRQRKLAQLEFAGAIPLDDALRQASQMCRPVVNLLPDSASATAFRDLANDLLHWRQGQAETGGAQHFFQQLLHLSQRITPAAVRTY